MRNTHHESPWNVSSRKSLLSFWERVPKAGEGMTVGIRSTLSPTRISIDNLNALDASHGRSLIRPAGTFSRGEKGIFVDLLFYVIPAAQNWYEIAQNCAAGMKQFFKNLTPFSRLLRFTPFQQ
jgi:hypothetical protein